MSDLVQLTKDNDIAIITINNPPVNALSPGVPEGIAEAIEQIDKDPSVKAAVLIGGGTTFIAGRGHQGVRQDHLWAEAGRCGAGSGSAAHGRLHQAGGGGHSWAGLWWRTGDGDGRALSCMAAPTAVVGQPEVNLGLIPGAAGSSSVLPRLAGVVKALEMCVLTVSRSG